MKLYLVQHGDAVARQVDPDRPLSAQGRADIERLARLLAARGIRVSRVFHSGKTRAKQTAESLAAALGGAVAAARTGLNPNDPTDAVLQDIAQGDDDVLLVGHLPFLGRLASRLLGRKEAKATLGFRPGSAACLERDGDGRWIVAWFLPPEMVG